MDFYGDPFAEQLNTLHEFFRWWAWANHEKKKTGMNVLYPLMMSVRNTEGHQKDIEENVRRNLVLGQPIRVPAIERHLIARKIDMIMNDPDLWRGHYGDRMTLVCYYLDRTANPIGCDQRERVFSTRMRVSRREVKSMVRTALIYFSTLWSKE